MPIDYNRAATQLKQAFENAEGAVFATEKDDHPYERINGAFETVFSSRTQAFREALLGCLLARIDDENIDIRKPYVSQGEDSYNGRTLDERVINPILQEKQIPCSRGPFLSVFRRSVKFDQSTRGGLRDKSGYDAFLQIVGFIESLHDRSKLIELLDFLASSFVKLREATIVPLTRIQRMSLEQLTILVSQLLATPSGGRLPVYLIVATLKSIKHYFDLDWNIEWQGINVADSASGVDGDIIVSSKGKTLLAAEVTERSVDRNRVVATFNTKIGPHGIDNYLFFVTSGIQPSTTIQQVKQYFAQGHEINFVTIEGWIRALLATTGGEGRTFFISQLLELLDSPETPAILKVAWNEKIAVVISSP